MHLKAQQFSYCVGSFEPVYNADFALMKLWQPINLLGGTGSLRLGSTVNIGDGIQIWIADSEPTKHPECDDDEWRSSPKVALLRFCYRNLK